MSGPSSASLDGRLKVLLVEDQAELAETVRAYLSRHEFEVVVAPDGQRAVEAFDRARPDIVVLDLGLPDTDGTLLLGRFASQPDVPVMVVTGRGDEVDRVVGLELGAVDYVTKPFSLRELLARLRAHLRHRLRAAEPPGAVPEPVPLGPYRIDIHHREVRHGERRLDLTAAELDLLILLLERDTVSRDAIAGSVLRKPYNPGDRSVDQLVSRLRAALGDLPWGAIESVRGIGYRLLRP
ncbi:MAG: response regulator transcription factor [Pseudomonadota bacterium]